MHTDLRSPENFSHVHFGHIVDSKLNYSQNHLSKIKTMPKILLVGLNLDHTLWHSILQISNFANWQ